MFTKGKPNPYHKKSVAARIAKGGYSIPWNKGLTKETSPAVMKYAIQQLGKSNSVFKMDNPLKFLYENGLKTRALYRGSKDNPSPKNGRQFSVNQDKSMLKRCLNICEACHQVKHSKQCPLESDHILANALGGETKISNGQMLCKSCHVLKTNIDKRLIREKHSVKV